MINMKSFWIKYSLKFFVHTLVGVLLSLSVVDYYRWRAEAPTVVEYTNIGDIGLRDPVGYLSLEDIGIDCNGLGSKKYRYTLDVVIEAEDEYWEIEKFGDKYYRVRREDYDDGLNGHYEFDSEEEIGTLEDLYEYVKNNGIPKKY